MDTKYLIIGVFVVLLLVTALQAYQLSTINAKLSGLKAGTVATTNVQTVKTTQTQQGLPSQVGGC